MENECIMRVSILEITFPLIVETLGNGNKFAYYLKIFENRLVSVRTKFPDILKHSHGYILYTSSDETIGRFRLLIPATKFLSVISMEGYSLYIAYFLALLKKQGFFPGMKNYFFGTAWKRDGFTLVIKNNNDIRGE